MQLLNIVSRIVSKYSAFRKKVTWKLGKRFEQTFHQRAANG
jgi:hypothetical protein